jgi:predicted nucleotidyltransferase
MYLDRILGSKTKINILATLISADDKEFIESELAKKVGCSLSEVNRQIVDLVNCGLIEMKKVGRAKVYSINKKHFLFKALKILFQDLTNIYKKAAKEITKFITRKYRIFAVILFGSLARGKIRSDFVREPSDIDLIIVVRKEDVKKIKNELITFINEKIFSKYGVVAYPIVISLEEYRNSLIHNDPLIVDVHANGEVLYGEKPKVFS